MSNTLGALLLAALVACGGENGNKGNDGGNQQGSDAGGIDAGIDAPPPVKRVRFVAIGDAGKGNAVQRQVAIAIRDVCAAKGCDFVLMLGDNIYDAGVDSVTDPQWQTKFEQPYVDVDLPFYVALGNHDNGGKLLSIIDAPGIGNEFAKGMIEVDYTAHSTKWNMPATHYTFRVNHVGVIVLDTNAMIWSNTTYGDQAAWLPTAMMELQGTDWTFLAGHHPYRSNGTHGNAGAYDAPELDGIPIQLPNPLPIQNGATVKTFFDTHLCGLGQVYFAGHDHSRQWLDEPSALCGTQMVISGAGASTTELRDRGNSSRYEDADKPGFFYVDVDGDQFTGTFYDSAGTVDYTHTFTKP